MIPLDSERDAYLSAREEIPIRINIDAVKAWIREHRGGWNMWWLNGIGISTVEAFDPEANMEEAWDRPLFSKPRKTIADLVLEKARKLGLEMWIRRWRNGEYEKTCHILPPEAKNKPFRLEWR